MMFAYIFYSGVLVCENFLLIKLLYLNIIVFHIQYVTTAWFAVWSKKIVSWSSKTNPCSEILWHQYQSTSFTPGWWEVWVWCHLSLLFLLFFPSVIIIVLTVFPWNVCSDAFARLYDRRMLPPLTSHRKRMNPPPCANYFCPMHLSEHVSSYVATRCLIIWSDCKLNHRLFWIRKKKMI
jgi:hypothetical protein